MCKIKEIERKFSEVDPRDLQGIISLSNSIERLIRDFAKDCKITEFEDLISLLKLTPCR